MAASAISSAILIMRNLFHVPDKYFLSHSVGCLPKSSEKKLQEHYIAPWAQMGGNAWPSWLGVLDDYREKLGRLIGTHADCVCPQNNVSSALTKILYSLPPPLSGQGTRNVIVMSEQDFPTNGFVFKQAERSGYTLKFVQGDITDTNVWDGAIDDTAAIVHFTHALSNTSHLLPAKEICDIARRNGAISIADVAQSVGVVPIDVSDWEVDFAIGTGVKFLCSGPGACFMYASKNMLDICAPVDVGWFSHENPFEMDIHDFRYAADAMKFFGGTPSPAPFILANESLNVLQTLGHQAVYDVIQNTLSKLTETLPREIIQSPLERTQRGAALVIAPRDRAQLRAALQSKEFLHDERAEGFRFSVHGYTSTADIDALQQVLMPL